MDAIEGIKFIIDVVDQGTSTLKMVRGQFRAFAQDVQNNFRGVRNMMGSLIAPLKAIGHYAGWAGAILGGLATAGAYKLTQGIVGATTEAETLRARLQTLFGTRWTGAWKWATGFAKDTPYQLEEIISAVARLSSYQIDPFKNLRNIGDFAAAMGRPMLDAVEAISDAVMGEWERMKEFGVKRETLEKWMVGKGIADPFNRSGQITNQSGMLQGLFGLMSERASGGMMRMMDTIAGKWSNIQDAAWRFFVTLGDKAAPYIKRVEDFIINLIDTLNSPALAGKAGAWIERMFSRENMSLVAGFFSNLYVLIRYLPERMTEAANGIKGVLSNVGTWLIGFAETIGNVFVRIDNGIIDSINKMVSWANQHTKIINNPVLRWILLGPGAMKLPKWESAPTMDLIKPVDLTGQKNSWQALMNGASLGNIWTSLGTPWTQEAATMRDTLMRAWDKTAVKNAPPALTNPLNLIANNTGAMAQKMDALSEIYGGGPRAKLLAGRFLFGGGAEGGAVTVNLNIRGGSASEQTAAEAAVTSVLKAIRVPHTVSMRGI